MLKIQKNVLLSKFTNYKIGGPARFFLSARTEKDLKNGIEWAKSKKLRIFILGGGTNLLVSDRGFNGLVIKIDIKYLKRIGLHIHSGAGVDMSDLIKFSIKNNLSGLEWAGGLPGTLGGAIRGNAGAFRGETKDSILSVKSFNVKSSRFMAYSRKKCDFSYRSSYFKNHDNEEIITSAILKLKRGNSKLIANKVKEKMKFRKLKHPLEYPNSGSVFKNVDIKKIPKKTLSKFRYVIKTDPFPVLPTAVLIANANLKGKKSGGAMISTKHPNFIVNVRKAKAKDVLALIRIAKQTVKKKFGVTLEEEVQIIK